LSTSQSNDARIAGVLLSGIVGALSDRAELSHAEKDARALGVWSLISHFEPRDPMQMMLIGQMLIFHELIADGGRDVMRGMMDTMKLRAQSNLNGLNRSLHQNLGMFLKLRDKLEAAMPVQEEARETPAAAKQPPEPVRKAPPQKAAVPVPPRQENVPPPQAPTEDESRSDEIAAESPRLPDAAIEPYSAKPAAGPVMDPGAMRADQVAGRELVETS
jgi:hypothetical protein